MVEKTLTKDELKKQLEEEKEKAELEKKEKTELEESLAKAKKELEDSQLRRELEIEEEIQRRAELAKQKENVDIYVKITAVDDFNWPSLLKIKKGESITLNQTRFDFLVNNVGNFKLAIETGKIRIG